MSGRLFTVLKFLLGWPLSIFALFFIVKIISPNIPKVSAYFESMHVFFLILGIFCFIFYYFLRSFLWKTILQYKGHSISMKETSFLWGMSEIKRFLPGNIWSLLGRTTAFSQKGIKKSTIVSSLILEAEFFLLGSIVLSLIAFPFIAHILFPHVHYSPLIFSGIPILVVFFTFCFLNTSFLLKRIALPLFMKHIFPPFSFHENFFLFLISCLSLFFFGLGTYFSIHALFFLNPQYFITLIGLFICSLCIGYLSLVTPMGLGVREAVMTAGLSQLLPLEIAGFGAIFARIILIIAELLFLLIGVIWHKTKSISLNKIEQWVKNYWQEIVLGVCTFAYYIYFTAASFYRYKNYYTGRFDLGNMDQTVWNTLHGHFFQLTNPDGTNIVSRLSFHADFFLILLAPFYVIWQDPRTLLLIQTLILGGGAIFLFLITKKLLQNKTAALLFAIAYLFNPSIQYSNLYDFHAVTLATTFFLAAYYFLLKRSYVRCIIFLFLAAITKEQIWIVTALFGLYMIFFNFKISLRKEKLLGLSIFLISSILFYIIFFRAIPAAHGGGHFALAYYADFGSSPSGIIKSIVFSPQKTITTLFALNRLEYLKQVFLPFGFLPLLEPLFLVFTLPDLVINLLSNNAAFHQIYYQYTAAITPFLFIGTLFAIKKIHSLFPKVRISYLLLFILTGTILTAYLYGPLPGAKNPNLDMFIKPQPYAEVIDNFLNDIPQKYSIAATNNLGSHLSHRQKIFTIPVGIDEADFILFLLNDKFAAPSLDAQIQMANAMKHDKKYIEIIKAGDFIVFEKRNLYVHNEPDVDKIKLFPVSIQTLEERDFVGGKIQQIKKLEDRKEFTSYLISYPSDGLTVNALMDIPTGKKPLQGFPVIILNHGFIRPALYDTEKSYRFISDYFAAHGFIVIKPDYRGNANSEKDTNMSYMLSYPIDVLNLISSIVNIQDANPQEVFLWGHSTGGEVTLTTLAVNNQNPDFPIKIKGTALWSPVSDPYRAYQQFTSLYQDTRIPYARTVQQLGTPDKNPLLWQSVSPLYYLDDISTPIQIMHGTSDAVVPYQWSIELYNDLISLNKRASLQVYPSDDHVLTNSRTDALEKNLKFFEQLLKQ